MSLMDYATSSFLNFYLENGTKYFLWLICSSPSLPLLISYDVVHSKFYMHTSMYKMYMCVCIHICVNVYVCMYEFTSYFLKISKWYQWSVASSIPALFK